MKNLFFYTIAVSAAVLIFSGSVFAGYVKGYTKKDGTYVEGHYKSKANKTVTDNYSYKDNFNPYTGESGTNKYKKSKTSEYYDGGF